MSGALLRDLLDVLVDGTRRALRLRVEGRSTARGTPPAWLSAGAAFDVVALEEGSTVIEIEAPTLDEALAAEVAQIALFEELDASRPGFELLTESLSDALEGKVDSDGYDNALLQRFEDFDRLFERGVSTIRIASERAGVPREELTIRPESLENVKRLRKETPPDQYVRVAGRLDVIRHSDRMFALILESGATLRGIAEGLPPGRLAEFFGRQVVVSGTTTFRPSGRVQTIEAEQIDLAGEDAALWTEEPRPLLTEAPRKHLYREQGPRSGINAVIGAWPGDETDAEIQRFLNDLS